MDILLLAQFIPPVVGGEERHVYNLGKALSRDHDVSLATFGDQHGMTSRDGMTIYSIRPGTASLPFLYSPGSRVQAPPLPDPVVSGRLHGILKRVRPDVVHAHNWIFNSIVPLAPFTSAPIVLSLHDYSHVCATKRMMYHDENRCAGPRFDRCVRCSWAHYRGPVGAATLAGVAVGKPFRERAVDKFLAVSSSVARLNNLDSSGVPYEVVPNFISDDLLHVEAEVPPKGFAAHQYFVFVGDVSRDKGIEFLLSAYRRMPAGRLPLLVIGRRTSDSPATYPPGVYALDPLEHPKVLQAMANASFVVVPSIWHDPCPTVVLEAMATGRPVVTTPLGGIIDMVTDGVEGLVVQPGDIDGLANAIMRLSRDSALRERLGAAAREKAAYFTTGMIVPRIEQIYRELTMRRESDARRS
jgi:glycosyltransferase involved in cell wall biosynthesis